MNDVHANSPFITDRRTPQSNSPSVSIVRWTFTSCMHRFESRPYVDQSGAIGNDLVIGAQVVGDAFTFAVSFVRIVGVRVIVVRDAVLRQVFGRLAGEHLADQTVKIFTGGTAFSSTHASCQDESQDENGTHLGGGNGAC
jgi:hypothetical protein